jgi:[ribosomal protein S5]-alanine N-acetyltransferase
MIPITTLRLQLRDFTESDFPSVHAYASDPVVTQYLSWGPNDEAMTRDFLSVAAVEWENTPRTNYSLAVVLSETKELIGSGGLMGRRLEYREYEIGYCFAQSHWGKGYATEVVKALLTFGFRELKAHRIFASVDPANLTSCHLLEKIGFRLEGLQRSDTFARGKWYNSVIYALLSDDV